MEIELKNLNEIDPGQLAYCANDIRVSRYLRDSFPYPYTIENALSFIQHVTMNNAIEFGIVVNGICIGCIGATLQKDIYRYNCEIGYWIGYDYWGKGIMSQVIPLFMQYLFQNFQLHKIYAEVFAQNEVSSHLLKKCGFQREGYFIEHIYKNNQFYDSEIYCFIGGS